MLSGKRLLWGDRRLTLYTVSERDMLQTMIAYFDSENKNELVAILKVSDFVYAPQYEFSGIVSYQRKLYASIRVPLSLRKKALEYKDEINKIACEIYQSDENYYFYGVKEIGIKPIQTEEIDFCNKFVVMEKDSVYSNFIKFVLDNDGLNDIQKKYLFEACNCGEHGDILAATVMLGASAEMMLLDMADAYCKYLSTAENQTAAEAFDRKVIKARCANDRLTEFLKRAETNASLFNAYGFENLRLNFSFLDVIRKTRNDSGHPTGNSISEEELKTLLANYQLFIPKMLRLIKELPLYTV